MMEIDYEFGIEGCFVGTDREPARYRLARFVHHGGEGFLWRCTSVVDGAEAQWAVKILPARNIRRGDVETLQEALDSLERKWQATIERTALLRDINGIVPVVRVFQGPAPTQDGRPEPGGPRVLCLVSPWIAGKNLHGWQRSQRPGLPDVVSTIERLSGIVDSLGDRKMVHRDLSPGNVMIGDDGSVWLIDFAFMRPPGAVTQKIGTRGYTAPEPDIDPANDRYSVGALTYFLLAEDHLPPGNAAARARTDLLARGYPPALADHVALLLDAEQHQRPARLLPWAQELRSLSQQRAASISFVDVTLELDTQQAAELTAGGTAVASGRLSPTLHFGLRIDRNAPANVASLAAARSGNGDITLFTNAGHGSLWVRVNRQWRQMPAADIAGAVRAAAQGDGSVAGFARTTDGELLRIQVGLDGTVDLQTLPVPLQRIAAAAQGPDGRAVLLAEDGRGLLLCGQPHDLAPVGLQGMAAAGLTVNQWDELVCVAATADGKLVVAETLHGEWDMPDWRDAPAGIRDIACLGNRDGLCIGVACATGLWIWRENTPEWRSLWTEPTAKVALSLSRGGRLQAAGVSGREVFLTEETGPGNWNHSLAEV